MKKMYKWCVVPGCTNTTSKTPEKLFICVPKKPKIRKMWLKLARRNPDSLVADSTVFFCEDHFNMEKDMANYYKYKMGFSQKIFMVDGVVPSKFHCQQELLKRMSNSSTETYLTSNEMRQPSKAVVRRKRQRTQPTLECTNRQQAAEKDVISKLRIIKTETLQTKQNKSISTEPIVTAEKSVQCNIKEKVHFRSKAVQTKILTKDVSLSPFQNSTTSSYTPPFKVKQCCCHIKPSKSGIVNIKRRTGFIDEEKSDSDIILYTEALKEEDISSLSETSSSKISDSNTDITDIDKLNCLQHNLCLIVKKPMMYIGISEECHVLLNLIQKHTDITHEHILLCLKRSD